MVYWTEVGNILLYMRIMKVTGCWLGMSLGSKHLISLSMHLMLSLKLIVFSFHILTIAYVNALFILE